MPEVARSTRLRSAAREGHRRKFSEADKRRIVEEAVQPGAGLSEVALHRRRLHARGKSSNFS
jgi:transposase-like protein